MHGPHDARQSEGKEVSDRREDVAEFVDDALFLDPADTYDDAILGVATRADGMRVVAYDRDRCITGLMRGGLTREESHEWMDFNTTGAWVGDMTPVFIEVVKRKR